MNPINKFKALATLGSKSIRVFGTSSTLGADDGWFSKVFVRRIEPTKESHSRMLSDKEIIYALHTHNMRPDCVDKYLKNYSTSVDFVHAHKGELGCELGCELVGSWTVSVGDMDQALHLWRYVGGFKSIDKAKTLFKESQEYCTLEKERGMYLRSRHLQYLLAFSFWPSGEPRSPSNIYEIRSYSLKPGTMIEWGNNWARAINYRRNNDEAFAGFFSQVGRLYNVHHIWCYKDLQARRETRENTWRNPGWDECVAYTVPLIKAMHCRILEPTQFSPTQ